MRGWIAVGAESEDPRTDSPLRPPPDLYKLWGIMLCLSTATRFRIRASVLPGLGRSQRAARASRALP